jgi:hypothetical protein
MAFVFRSEKITEINPGKEEFDIGPGQYLPQTLNNPPKPNKVPFGMGSKKGQNNLKKLDDIPGPGSYFSSDNHLNFFNKTFNVSKNEKLNINDFKNLNAALDSSDENIHKNVKNLEYLGFLSKDKRFKENKDQVNPGPGHYNEGLDENEKLHINKKITLKNPKFHRNVLNSGDGKVISIPNKNQGYGFEKDFEGVLRPKEDPEFYKRHKGDKGDIVGPGNYEVQRAYDWLKKGTVWSKSTTKKYGIDCFSNTNYNKVSRSFDGDLMKNDIYCEDYSDQNRDKRKTISFQKFNCNNNVLRKKNRKEINRLLMQRDSVNMIQVQEKIMLTETPGPGYYYEDKTSSSFKIPKNNQNKQNFMSNLQRFEEVSNNHQVGPGSYFKTEKNKKKYEKQTFSKSNVAPFFEIKNMDNPGPGYYEPLIEKKKPNTAKNNNFGSSEKRFVDFSKQIKETTPGPGSYLDFNSTMNSTVTKWTGYKNNDFKNLTITRALTSKPKQNIKKHERNLDGFGNKQNIPAVGSYNPETIFSIDYKIKKANSKMSLIEAPFNSTLKSKRFYDKFNQEAFSNIGPGYYYKNYKQEKKQIYPPFKSNETRFNEKRKDENSGPGNYNRTSYFDWNKKSYNILYL